MVTIWMWLSLFKWVLSIGVHGSVFDLVIHLHTASDCGTPFSRLPRFLYSQTACWWLYLSTGLYLPVGVLQPFQGLDPFPKPAMDMWSPHRWPFIHSTFHKQCFGILNWHSNCHLNCIKQSWARWWRSEEFCFNQSPKFYSIPTKPFWTPIKSAWDVRIYIWISIGRGSAVRKYEGWSCDSTDRYWRISRRIRKPLEAGT